MAQNIAPEESVRIGTEPETEYESKSVMLRAERGDTLLLEGVEQNFGAQDDIPVRFKITRRTNTYFGPKLEAESNASNWMITSPGPESQILLWKADTSGEFVEGWYKVAEVTMAFSENDEGYDLCPVCNEPLRTLEHERLAAIGKCPD